MKEKGQREERRGERHVRKPHFGFCSTRNLTVSRSPRAAAKWMGSAPASVVKVSDAAADVTSHFSTNRCPYLQHRRNKRLGRVG